MRIEFVSPVEEIDPENDNIDVFLHLEDGRTFSFLIATPNNIYRCMDNEGLDRFISYPPQYSSSAFLPNQWNEHCGTFWNQVRSD